MFFEIGKHQFLSHKNASQRCLKGNNTESMLRPESAPDLATFYGTRIGLAQSQTYRGRVAGSRMSHWYGRMG